jgi:hypothetical protein
MRSMPIILTLLIILLACSQIGMTQPVHIIDLDIGITFSQFPTRGEWTSFHEVGTDPLLRPIIGISKEWTLKKHLQLASGLQYQMAGTKYHELIFYGQWEEGTFVYYKLQKLCFPLTLGYIFKIGTLKPSCYLGVRPNLILSAKMDDISTDTQMGPHWSNQHRNDLFDYYIPPKRFVNQFTLGLSTELGQHIKINLNYNIGHNDYTDFTTNTFITGATHSHIIKTSIPSSDYIISVQYFLNSKKVANDVDNLQK